MLMQMLDDAAVIALIPAVVAALRRTGLPDRLATAAMVASGVVLVCLADLAAGATAVSVAVVAGWLLTGLIDGLAAAGLTRLGTPGRAPATGAGEPVEIGSARPLR